MAIGTVDVQVVAVAPEQRMRLHADGDVEIAVFAAVAPDVSLARHADPRAVRQTRAARRSSAARSRISTCCAAAGRTARLR